MADLSLDFLDQDAQRLVRQMLAMVVDYPTVHVNRLRLHPLRTGEYRYFVGQKGGNSAFPNNRSLPVNIFPSLQTHGWIEKDRSPGANEGVKRFTAAALEWHREHGGPSDHQIQERIGRALFAHVATDHPERTEQELVAELGLPEARVH